MHILAGFYGSIANGSVYTAIPGAVDAALTLLPSSYYLSGQKIRLLAAAGLGASMTALQLDAPSLRVLALPEVYPAIAAAAVPDRYAFCFYGTNGPQIQANEGFLLKASVGGGAASDNFGALWLAPQFVNAPPGPSMTVPFTATITAVKGSWVLGALTAATTLPVGRYAVVGMEAVASNTWLARLVFPGSSIQFRPGVIANTTYGRVGQTQYNRFGGMGSFGEFDSTALPALEIFGLAAGAAAPTVYLDLIKTR
jgi:hypothetical protein